MTQVFSIVVALSGWTPFFEPLNIFHTWWFLLAVPLAICLSVIYKAMRVRDGEQYWRQVMIMTLQILLGMAGLIAVLFLLVEVVVPRL